MQKPARLSIGSGLASCLLTFLSLHGVLPAQTANLPSSEPGKSGEPLNWTTQEDHKNMLEQLGIVRLRPGPSGQPGTTNSANYDPAKANPFPDLPDVLTLKNGHEVKTAEMWWKQRRPEIVEDFEREVIGRVPRNVPKVTWTVVSNIVDGLVGNLPANGKRLIGHVDNSACPVITVDLRMILVTPAKAKGPVPILMMFGRAHKSLSRVRWSIQGSPVNRTTTRSRLGIRHPQPWKHPRGQWRWIDKGHHRSRQQGPAP